MSTPAELDAHIDGGFFLAGGKAMIEFGDNIFRDEMMREQLCFMCLSHKDLYRAEYSRHNRKQVMICKDCIKMNGHRVCRGKDKLFTPKKSK